MNFSEFFYPIAEALLSLLDFVYGWVWGLPLLLLISGTGIYLTIVLRGIQFRELPKAIKLVISEEKDKSVKGDISNFESLMTALAATLGIGNIAGVATAVVVGGPGALFWMWITALLGMAIKYSEAFLAVKFRAVDERGEMAGGPMFFIQNGLKWRGLAISFALFTIISSFGGGNMLQANSIAHALHESFAFSPLWVGIVMAAITWITLLGGIKSIAKVACFAVPLMAFIYIGGAMVVLTYHFDRIPEAIWTIFVQAFTGQAAVGGIAGASFLAAVQVGVSRGLMTSEAGLGTASIAAAAAKTNTPGQQALISMAGCFLATVILCTVTALVLGVTGVVGTTDAAGNLVTGAALTMAAFTSVISWGGYVVTFGIILFGWTTIIGWAYYGEKCVEYLIGVSAIKFYRILFTLVIIPGAVLDLAVVWKISDIFNGLMAIPNLIGLVFLSHIVVKETRAYLEQSERDEVSESAMEVPAEL